ncbi:hypothetical protein [Micromonospora sp. NRRL B-16802]|uniref:hypothetical protein n=1 Tax=Micromonospora sp. NRRL B-16802 TaxID=1415541 RepID=UPI0012FC4D5A|nr:hypothetical protein [Micromonospora sp. NRRL B-16802]
MTTIGIAVSMTPKRPVVSCVLLDGTRSDPTTVGSFDLKTASDYVMDQGEDLAKQLSSKLAALGVDAAVIRIADFAPVASRSAAPRHRLLIEGALGFVCKSRLSDVWVRTGKEIGLVLGMSKPKAESAGRALDKTRASAASAALSALSAA